MVVNASAQIPVTNSGTAPITFDSPLATTEWATLTHGIGTDTSTYFTPASVDAAAQTIDQSQVADALPATTVNGNSQAAQHNTSSAYLLTRPTGIGAVVLKATLRNTSRLGIFSIKVSYDFDVPALPAYETAPGHRAFWSPTGQTNSWNLLTNFSGLNARASVNETIRFSTPWTPNSDIYLLWLDDNATTGPEGAYTIDNFTVSDVSTLRISFNPLTGAITVKWAGSGVLQTAPTLENFATDFSDVSGNSNSYIFTPQANSQSFFNLRP